MRLSAAGAIASPAAKLSINNFLTDVVIIMLVDVLSIGLRIMTTKRLVDEIVAFASNLNSWRCAGARKVFHHMPLQILEEALVKYFVIQSVEKSANDWYSFGYSSRQLFSKSETIYVIRKSQLYDVLSGKKGTSKVEPTSFLF
jgi:hypothetical protein